MYDAAQDPTWNRKFTWPNLVSAIRLLIGLPAFYVVLVLWHHKLAAVGVYAGFALSDNIDGYMARQYHWRSRLGQMLDPTIDRVYMVFAIVLIVHSIWSWWLLVMLGPLAVREIAVGWFFLALKFMGRETGSPTLWGKRSAFLTNIVVCLSVVAFAASGKVQLAVIVLVAPLLLCAVAMSYGTAHSYWKTRPRRKER